MIGTRRILTKMKKPEAVTPTDDVENGRFRAARILESQPDVEAVEIVRRYNVGRKVVTTVIETVTR